MIVIKAQSWFARAYFVSSMLVATSIAHAAREVRRTGDPVTTSLAALATIARGTPSWTAVRGKLPLVQWQDRSPKLGANPAVGQTHVMSGQLATEAGTYDVYAHGTAADVTGIDLIGPDGEPAIDRPVALQRLGISTVRIRCAGPLIRLFRFGNGGALLKAVRSAGSETAFANEYDVDFAGRSLADRSWETTCN